jgi:glycosyltransferase involved in cell wall biosynthesis
MAERISRILADPDQAKTMGEQGRARARACFSIERYIQEMSALFEEVVSLDPPGSG